MKCPACGYTDQKQKQNSEARIIYEDFPNDIRDNLIFIGEKLRQFFHSNRIKREWNQLMYAIDSIPYIITRTTVNQYLLHKYYKEGKGFPYLKTMILISSKNFKKNRSLELRKYGSNPPLITDEEE